MAVLASIATGNFTSSSTWATCDSTSFLDSESNNTALTTSYVASAAFTPGAITVDGIGVKVFSRQASPTGTVSIELYNSTGAASVKTVTINVSDLHADANGWYFFKFDASTTLLAATNYQVRAKTSNTAQVNLYRNATAGNWSRFLRTTTTAAPAASDQIIVVGEMTGAGTSNTFTVTMDSTSSATAYGQTDVCDKGEFYYGSTASTNYYLKLAGDLDVYAGGTFTINHGTGGTAKLEFSCASNVQYGFLIKKSGTVYGVGDTKTVSAYLAADASAAATSLTTDVSTGWLNGDQIGIASTTRTASQSEKKSLTANAAGTTLTIAAITNAHEGNATYKAELINLTRTTQIFSSSTTLQTFCNFGDATYSFDYVEFYNMGSATAGKRGLDVNPINTEPQFTGCSLHDFNVTSSLGIYVSNAASGGLYIADMVSYNIEANHFNLAATTGTGHVILGWTGIKSPSGSIFDINDKASININGLYASGSQAANGINFTDNGGFGGTCTNMISHSNAAQGFNFGTCRTSSSTKASITNVTAWKNTTHGIAIDACDDLFFQTVYSYGNATSAISFLTGVSNNITIQDLVAYSTTSFTQARGIYHQIDTYNCLIESSDFAVSGSASSYHSTGDVDYLAANIMQDLRFNSCNMNSTTQFSNTSNLLKGFNGVRSGAQDSGNGQYRYHKYGIQRKDTTIYYEGSQSLRLTPNNANYKFACDIMRVFVVGGQTATVSVWVRKSSAGDGTAYTGSQPRLIMLLDTYTGYTSETVCDTMTAGTGTWEQLTFTSVAMSGNTAFSFVVDCDGTAGWINIDKWEAS